MNDNNNSDYIFKAFMVNAFEYDNGNKETSGTWLYFPADKEQITAAFEEIGLVPDADSGKYFFDDYVCNIESIKQLLPLNISVSELQYTAEKLNTLSPYDVLKLNAVMETNARFETLAQVKEFTYNKDYFTLIPDISNTAELGAHIIYPSGIFSGMPHLYRDAIEPESFGKYIAEAEQGVFTSKGYVSLSGDDWWTADLSGFKPKPLKVNALEKEYDTTNSLASDLDDFFRSNSPEYVALADDPIRAKENIAFSLRTGSTDKVRNQLKNYAKEYYIGKAEIQPFENRIARFEKCKGIERKNPLSIKEQLRQAKNAQSPKKAKHKEECL